MSKPAIYDQLIIDGVIASLLEIAAGSDYYVTPKKVFDANPTPFDVEDELPAYNIQEGDESLTDEAEGSETVHDMDLPLFIDIVTKDTATARQMKADLLKKIKDEITTGSYFGLAIYSSKQFIYGIKFVNAQSNVVNQNGLGDLIANKRINIEIFYRKPAWS